MWATFKNNNEVDINAFRLIGASSKEDDHSKIGFWGSGLKYAMAVLLRHGIKIKAFTGTKEVKIGLRKTKMRGEDFQVITINGTPTSITTRMGKDWEVWFAIRELYTNGLDEEGFELKVEDNFNPEKGITKIYVELTDEIKDVFDNFDEYFSKNRKTVVSFPDFQIFERMFEDRSIIYRRGIRVHSDKENLLFDYDLRNVAINESRVIKSAFEMDWALTSVWKSRATREMIERFLVNKCYEKRLEFSYGSEFSILWYEILKDKIIIPEELGGYYTEDLKKPSVTLPMSMCKALAVRFNGLTIRGVTTKGQDKPVPLDITKDQLDMIAKAIIKLKPLGNILKYQIQVVRMVEEETLGLAEDGIIYVDISVFDQPRLLASTILEEFVHLEYGFEDHSRKMQNFLFKTIIELL